MYRVIFQILITAAIWLQGCALVWEDESEVTLEPGKLSEQKPQSGSEGMEETKPKETSFLTDVLSSAQSVIVDDAEVVFGSCLEISEGAMHPKVPPYACTEFSYLSNSKKPSETINGCVTTVGFHDLTSGEKWPTLHRTWQWSSCPDFIGKRRWSKKPACKEDRKHFFVKRWVYGVGGDKQKFQICSSNETLTDADIKPSSFSGLGFP